MTAQVPRQSCIATPSAVKGMASLVPRLSEEGEPGTHCLRMR